MNINNQGSAGIKFLAIGPGYSKKCATHLGSFYSYY